MNRAAGTYLNMVRTDLFEIDPLAPYDPLPLPMQFDIILMRLGYAWYSKPKETFTSGKTKAPTNFDEHFPNNFQIKKFGHMWKFYSLFQPSLKSTRSKQNMK